MRPVILALALIPPSAGLAQTEPPEAPTGSIQTAAPAAILVDDRHAERFAELEGNRPRDDVGATAGCVGDDPAYRFCRVRLP